MKLAWLPDKMKNAPQLDNTYYPKEISHGNILLINPFYPKHPYSSFGKHVLTPTLALTTIAGATPNEWSVEIHDENLLQGFPLLDRFPEVVGITVHLTFADRAYELADWFRKRGARIILGGLHVTSCPEEALAHADAIISGEGTSVWPAVLSDIRNNQLKKIYRGSYRKDVNHDVLPRRDLLPDRGFLTTSSIIATRGCHNRCGFCYLSTRGLKMPYQAENPKHVAAKLHTHPGPYTVFLDNNLGANKEYLRKLCCALRPLDKIWSTAISLDVTDDPVLVRDMALAGCIGVFVGFESLSDLNLTTAGKKTPLVSDYARRVKIFHDNGIQVNGSFIFGFDHDRADIFDRTVDWIEENRLECSTFHILTPYPGTPFFRKIEQQGRLLHKDWNQYDTTHVVFQPRHMSPDELLKGYRSCYQKLFSHKSIWKRRPADWRALPPYLAMSYLYKRSNILWYFLIQHQLTAAVWRPLVRLSHCRHLRFRKRLANAPDPTSVISGQDRSVVPAGV